jgi:hypothetical protein
MKNTLKNIVYWSTCDRFLVINTRNKDDKYHNWEWVIREEELNDYTEWDYRDMDTVTDEMIESVEFPDGVEGFFRFDPLDYAD